MDRSEHCRGATLLTVATALTLTCCAAQQGSGMADGFAAKSVTYQCENGLLLKATYPTPDSANIVYQREHEAMVTAPSASGARYVGDHWEWWTRGDKEGYLAPIGDDRRAASTQGVRCAALQQPEYSRAANAQGAWQAPAHVTDRQSHQTNTLSYPASAPCTPLGLPRS